jgi:hypothetical protein
MYNRLILQLVPWLLGRNGLGDHRTYTAGLPKTCCVCTGHNIYRRRFSTNNILLAAHSGVSTPLLPLHPLDLFRITTPHSHPDRLHPVESDHLSPADSIFVRPIFDIF